MRHANVQGQEDLNQIEAMVNISYQSIINYDVIT